MAVAAAVAYILIGTFECIRILSARTARTDDVRYAEAIWRAR